MENVYPEHSSIDLRDFQYIIIYSQKEDDSVLFQKLRFPYIANPSDTPWPLEYRGRPTESWLYLHRNL